VCALDLFSAKLSGSEREIESHIYIVDGAEWREAIALMVWPVLFGWDAHLFFGRAQRSSTCHITDRSLCRSVSGDELMDERLPGWSFETTTSV
jgi:hypothetical protein